MMMLLGVFTMDVGEIHVSKNMTCVSGLYSKYY